ncbi:hypothetical protein PsYK624_168880 [Phanerochaete sordida]|uniref:Uncharacterized protein n=1 Tax=Phanerochaete sordida TaxID=48140 RepID=A0A9P3GY23_9APHY|nr:hypothetical protein PsYK624_168880 [Phanerochaete sordida]
MQTRSRSVYVQRTSAELPSCLRDSVDAELKRVFNHEEDDLDGWELESEPEALSADSSPLSSLPSSRAPSPTPSCAPSPVQSRAPSPLPSRVPSRVPFSPPSCMSMSESPRVPSTAPQVGSKRKNPPSPRESISTLQPNGAAGRQDACEAKPKREKTEADKAHQRKRKQAYKKKKKAEQQVHDPREYQAPAHALKKREQAGVIATDASAPIDLTFSRPVYVGKALGVGDVHPELAEQLQLGRQLVEWDGSSTEVLADKHGYYLGVLLEQPNDPTWQESAAELLKAIDEAGRKMRFKARDDRRGDFDTVAFDVWYGGGQTCPGNLKHSKRNRSIIEELLQNPHMVRMADHARTAFATYFPDLYDEYATKLGSLYDDNPLLRPLWDRCPWPSVSINFPPNSYTKMHTDSGNKANGMCPVFALGNYDYTKGGHLVLPDLNLVIQFPPGNIIFIPSAILRHGNIPVGPDEVRSSWTLYAAGSLFRWVDWGFKSLKSLSDDDLELEIAGRPARFKEALAKFPHVDTLRSHVPCT